MAVISADRLAKVEVLGPTGEKILLSSLWQKQPVVLALVRHFG
jgi:hypothetical protein